MAHRVGGQGVELTSAYWGAAEVNGTDGLGSIDANDPTRTSVANFAVLHNERSTLH
jgi:hypothetical protein